MLFTKKIEDISYEDVVEFCSQEIKESVNLDYKEDFTSHLDKTISSFANTYGGLIIIGVRDEDGSPDASSEGINYVDGLSERVQNINISNIYPPVNLDVKVTKKTDDSKCFVVIRVPQSNLVPHTIRHNTSIYYRTGDVSNPEDLMDFEKIEWLLDGRKKAEDFRLKIIKIVKDRLERMRFLKGVGVLKAETHLCISPLYPDKAIASYEEIKNVKDSFTTNGYHTHGFPHFSPEIMNVQGGILSFDSRNNSHVNSVELNQYGLFYKVDNMSRQDRDGGNVIYKAYLSAFLGHCHLFLLSSLKFYEHFNFFGPLKFELNIKNIDNVKLYSLGSDPFDDNYVYPIDSSINISRIFTSKELANNRNDILTDIIHELAWSLGIRNLTREVIGQYIGQIT